MAGHSEKKQINSKLSALTFTDASCRAYAAAAYLRVRCESRTVVALVAAKCRLAPPAGETISRLELTTVAMGSQALESLKTGLQGVVCTVYLHVSTCCPS